MADRENSEQLREFTTRPCEYLGSMTYSEDEADDDSAPKDVVLRCPGYRANTNKVIGKDRTEIDRSDNIPPRSCPNAVNTKFSGLISSSRRATGR